MNMTALVYVLLSLLLAVFSTGSLTDPPHFVYRADFREPQYIFQNGMQSWGTCENVYYHIKGKSCKKKTTAFISTTSSEPAAGQMAKELLDGNPKKTTIYIYKIRADETFYSAYYSLMFAANNYRQQGKNKKADKYENLAKSYTWQKEWMAYRAIHSTQIQLANSYPRHLVNLNQQGPVVHNAGYIDASTFGSEEPFPESMKGCPAFDKLKACLGF